MFWEILLLQNRLDPYKATERQKYDVSHAAAEARQCTDLLSQAQYHVARARKLDDENRAIRSPYSCYLYNTSYLDPDIYPTNPCPSRQQQEKAKQELENKRKEEEDAKKKEEEERHQAILTQREVYRERAKNILIFTEQPSQPKASKGRKKKEETVYSSGEASSGEPEMPDSMPDEEKEKKRREKQEKREKKKAAKEAKKKARKEKERKRIQEEREEKQGRYTSKAYISDSDSDGAGGDDDVEPVAKTEVAPAKPVILKKPGLSSDSSDLDEKPTKKSKARKRKRFSSGDTSDEAPPADSSDSDKPVNEGDSDKGEEKGEQSDKEESAKGDQSDKEKSDKSDQEEGGKEEEEGEKGDELNTSKISDISDDDDPKPSVTSAPVVSQPTDSDSDEMFVEKKKSKKKKKKSDKKKKKKSRKMEFSDESDDDDGAKKSPSPAPSPPKKMKSKAVNDSLSSDTD
eukprot:sb/3464525/